MTSQDGLCQGEQPNPKKTYCTKAKQSSLLPNSPQPAFHSQTFIWYLPTCNVKMKVVQSCLTLCDPMDYAVHGILQARILKWVAIPFYRGPSHPRNRTQVSHIAGRFFTSWATREQTPNIYSSILRHHQLNYYDETHRYNTYTFFSPLYFLKNGTTIFIQFVGIIFH